MFSGTHGYMAPEVLAKGTAYDSSADWFSFGCMIYKLLKGLAYVYIHQLYFYIFRFTYFLYFSSEFLLFCFISGFCYYNYLVTESLVQNVCEPQI